MPLRIADCTLDGSVCAASTRTSDCALRAYSLASFSRSSESDAYHVPRPTTAAMMTAMVHLRCVSFSTSALRGARNAAVPAARPATSGRACAKFRQKTMATTPVTTTAKRIAVSLVKPGGAFIRTTFTLLVGEAAWVALGRDYFH